MQRSADVARKLGFASSLEERESVLVEAEEFRRWEEFHRGARIPAELECSGSANDGRPG